MCAIIGFASYQPIKEKKWLNIGRDAMLHRGPDGFGEWWSSDDRVGFGHRRLSIHDLSIAGHQPMLDQTDAHTLVFNGEIYNYIEIRKVLISKVSAIGSKALQILICELPFSRSSSKKHSRKLNCWIMPSRLRL